MDGIAGQLEELFGDVCWNHLTEEAEAGSKGRDYEATDALTTLLRIASSLSEDFPCIAKSTAAFDQKLPHRIFQHS